MTQRTLEDCRFQRRPRRIVVAIAIALLLLGVTAVAAEAARVVTPTTVGRLVIGRSTQVTVIDDYGKPYGAAVGFLGYDCVINGVALTERCRINFFFNHSGRLEAAVLGAAGYGFRAPGGITIGMSVKAARRRARPLSVRRLCGHAALRYSSDGGAAGPWAGLSLLVRNGKVTGMDVVDPGEPVHCTGDIYGFG